MRLRVEPVDIRKVKQRLFEGLLFIFHTYHKSQQIKTLITC